MTYPVSEGKPFFRTYIDNPLFCSADKQINFVFCTYISIYSYIDIVFILNILLLKLKFCHDIEKERVKLVEKGQEREGAWKRWRKGEM